MSMDNVEECVRLAKTFLDLAYRIQPLSHLQLKNTAAPGAPCAALKRASMDLTKALARLRHEP